MSGLSTSPDVVFSEGLYYRISWAISWNNYRNCVKTRWQSNFGLPSHWILIISQRVSLINTLAICLLTALRITVALGQRLDQMV